MAKRLKLRFSFPSFQFCRLNLKQLSSFPKSPSPATYHQFSPFNPKAFNIGYPNIPEPPPSTPNHPFLFKRHVLSSPNTVPVDCGCNSKSPREKQPKTRRKLYTSSVSNLSASNTLPVRLPIKKKKERNKKMKNKKAKASVCISASSANSGWFSTDGSEYNEETESLVSSSRSSYSSSDFGCPLQSINERPINEYRRKNKNKKKKNLKVRRLKRYNSESWRGGEKTKKTMSPESGSPAMASVFRRLKESFTVVKRSENPHEDFKGSMLEMILEKHMFDAKDLEQLLMCFLSLNSPHHHATIVEAFVEVWEVLFCKTPPKSQRVSMGH
ncbi:transcription repressor OFP7-like [Camellia sinensis]|uniref:Transcription repressor n=1 Tax=Camellia sinensis TaxID=4442 RepID=A0A7J7GR37_CAMSI|nr:transcription repressor OFP7-like [Camellia sinensis]KAF5943249.1 hypothetical protein HYC85_020891 [Camellia sinensis]